MAVAHLLLLLLPALAAAQAQQMPTFSANDTNWRPTETNRTLVSNNGDFAAGFRRSPSSPAKFRFAVWVNANTSDSDSRPAVIWYAHTNSLSAVVASTHPTTPGETQVRRPDLLAKNSREPKVKLFPVGSRARFMISTPVDVLTEKFGKDTRG